MTFKQDIAIEGQAQLEDNVFIRPDVRPVAGFNYPVSGKSEGDYGLYSRIGTDGLHYHDLNGDGHNQTLPNTQGHNETDWDLPLHFTINEFPVITRVSYKIDEITPSNCDNANYAYLVGSLGSTGDRVYFGEGALSPGEYTTDITTCPSALPEFERVYYNPQWAIECSIYVTEEEVDLAGFGSGGCAISACHIEDVGITTHRVHVFLEDSDSWTSRCPRELEAGNTDASLFAPEGVRWDDEDPSETIAYWAASFASGAENKREAFEKIYQGFNSPPTPLGMSPGVSRKPKDAQNYQDGKSLYYYGREYAKLLGDPVGRAASILTDGPNGLITIRNGECRPWCNAAIRTLRMHGIQAEPLYLLPSTLLAKGWEQFWDFHEAPASAAVDVGADDCGAPDNYNLPYSDYLFPVSASSPPTNTLLGTYYRYLMVPKNWLMLPIGEGTANTGSNGIRETAFILDAQMGLDKGLQGQRYLSLTTSGNALLGSTPLVYPVAVSLLSLLANDDQLIPTSNGWALTSGADGIRDLTDGELGELNSFAGSTILVASEAEFEHGSGFPFATMGSLVDGESLFGDDGFDTGSSTFDMVGPFGSVFELPASTFCEGVEFSEVGSNMPGNPGQGTPMPDAKSFNYHCIVKVTLPPAEGQEEGQVFYWDVCYMLDPIENLLGESELAGYEQQSFEGFFPIGAYSLTAVSSDLGLNPQPNWFAPLTGTGQFKTIFVIEEPAGPQLHAVTATQYPFAAPQ